MVFSPSITSTRLQTPLRYKPRTTTHASNRSVVGDLFSALVQQTKTEVVDGWAGDLIAPIFSDDHGSDLGLPDTVPPTNLAEADSKYVTVSGISIHYKEHIPSTSTSNSSSNEAPTILMLHGFNGSVFNWRHALKTVSEATGLRTIAYDRPPFGLSQRPVDWGPNHSTLKYNPYELEGSAKLTRDFLKAVGIHGPIIVMGHSAGGLVTMEYHRLEPSRVAAMCLVAPAVPAKEGSMFGSSMTLGAQLRLLALRTILQGNPTGVRYVRRQILKQRDSLLRGDKGAVPHKEEYSNGIPEELLDGYLKPLKAYDWDHGALLNLRSAQLPGPYDFNSVTVPTLVVQGTHDSLCENARVLHEKLQHVDAKFVEFDCGHVPQEELPDEFNAAVIDFINSSVLLQ